MARQKQLWGPLDFFSLGIVLAIAGGIFAGLCFTGGQDKAGVVAAIALGIPASVFFQIGVIAKGVQVGMRDRA